MIESTPLDCLFCHHPLTYVGFFNALNKDAPNDKNGGKPVVKVWKCEKHAILVKFHSSCIQTEAGKILKENGIHNTTLQCAINNGLYDITMMYRDNSTIIEYAKNLYSSNWQLVHQFNTIVNWTPENVEQKLRTCLLFI